MNGYQRMMAALQGKQADTTPVMLHSFMMAAREAGLTMEQFRSDPNTMARAFIESVEKYEYDGIIVDVDTVTLAGAAGVPIDFPVDQPSQAAGVRIHTLEEVNDLPPVDIRNYRSVQVWLEAVTILRNYFGDEIFVRGNCDQSPFTLASLIRGLEPWMLDLANESCHELIHKLLEYSTAITLQFVQLMSETGAHMTSNGDSVAGPELISPAMFRTFALPYEKTIVDKSHSVGLPYFLHICGNTSRIIDAMLETGSDGLELDYKTDALLAHAKMKDRTVFIGNIDPSGVLALGTPQLVEEKTRELLTIFADTPRFILNAGCAIPPITPPENLKAMIGAARSF
ncbi:MAG: uroporphyrinogen decarboxylase family protein [Ignavibacteriales bacterium]|nr:uroporphyrinogen decarboxylase family protein [Ignavibacteriales bacterium]